MKKLIVAVVVMGVLSGCYVWLRSQRLSFAGIDAKFGNVKRGDLVIPIKASGKIQPKSKREIKSKASGEIIAIPVKVGQLVREKDVLLNLKKDDETRNRDAAKEAYLQAKIAVQLAEIDLRTRKDVAVPSAEAAQKRAEANLKRIEAEYEFKQNLRKTNPDAIPNVEWVTIQAQYEVAKADVAVAVSDVARAKLAIESGEKEVERLRSAATAAEARYLDAEERLSETTVRSPFDGMVLKQYRNVGEMIQSGTQSLTGGTILMDVADVSEVYMIASVDEADIGKVREMAPPKARPGFNADAQSQPAAADMVQQETIKADTPVEITVEAFPDEAFEGVIERISPESEVQAAVATFEVRIRVTSPNREKIRGLAGIQAEAQFTSVPVKGAMLVPYEAVQRDQKSGMLGVYVPVQRPGVEGETPEFRACKLGADNGVSVVVLEGLEEGERVYTKLPLKTEREKKAGEDSE